MKVIYVGEGGFPMISEALAFIEEVRANDAAEACRENSAGCRRDGMLRPEGVAEDFRENSAGQQQDGMLQANAVAEGCREKSAGQRRDGLLRSKGVAEDFREKPAGQQEDGLLRSNAAAPIEIRIAPGVYHEHLEILQPFVTLCGAGPEETVITGGLGAFEILEDGLKRGTFRTQTVFVHAHDVVMRNLTIENTAGPGHIAGQAIALYADGDRLVFENVHLKGFQDTLFTGPLPPKEVEPGGFRGPLQFAPRINGRQYYRDCRIEGSVDFIFGSATAYFERCTLVSLDEYAEEGCREEGADGSRAELDGSLRGSAGSESGRAGDVTSHPAALERSVQSFVDGGIEHAGDATSHSAALERSVRSSVGGETGCAGDATSHSAALERSVRSSVSGESGCAGDATSYPTAKERESATDKKQPPQIRGYVTAPSTPEGQEYGYVFADCSFVGDCPAESCYLGRPWREYARVVLIRCHIGKHIRTEGWHDWGKAKAHETAYFAEYGSCYEGKAEDLKQVGCKENRPGHLHLSLDESGAGIDSSGMRRYLHQSEMHLYERDRVLGSDFFVG